MTTVTKEHELEEAIDSPDLSDEGDEDPQEGWLVVWDDGVQQVFEHPEGKSVDQLLEEWDTARRKNYRSFRLGKNILDPMQIRCFGWADSSMFPEIEQFDSMHERVDALMSAQEALHQAQVASFGYEQQLAEAEEVEEEEPEPVPAPAPARQAPLKLGKPGKKLQRPN